MYPDGCDTNVGRHLRVFFLAGFVYAERKVRNVRILVANSPRMYREALAIAVLKRFPDAEMIVASPQALDEQAKRFSPHVVVRNDDVENVGAMESVVCWMGMRIGDSVDARISMGGRVAQLHDATMEDVLETLDEAAELLRAGGSGVEPSFS